MANVVKTLRDKKTGDYIIPRTNALAVTLSDGSTGLDTKLTSVDTSISNLTTSVNSKATQAEYTGTITTTWTGASAPFTQDVTISGILATDEPIITPVYSATNATAILERTAWNLIGSGVAGSNKITFTCFETKPVTAINIQIKVVR